MPRTLVQALAFLLGFWIALLLAPFTSSAASGEEPSLARIEGELYQAVNAERASRHLTLLARRADLDAVARAHAADMASRGDLSHQTPEGLDPLGRLGRAGITGFSLAAENAGQTSQAEPSRRILAHRL